jgi:hypothetical protein
MPPIASANPGRLCTGDRLRDAAACLSESWAEYGLLLTACVALALADDRARPTTPRASFSCLLAVTATLVAGHLAAYWSHRWAHRYRVTRALAFVHMRHHRGGKGPERTIDRALEFATNLTNSGFFVAAIAMLLEADPPALRRAMRFAAPSCIRPLLALPVAPALLAHAVLYAVAHVVILHDTRASVHAVHHANDGSGRHPALNFAPDLLDAAFGSKLRGQPFAGDISGEAVCAGGLAAAAALLLRDLL